MRLSNLRRITSSGDYVPEIDGLRFIAIASVVFYHVGGLTLIKFGVYDQLESMVLNNSFQRILFHSNRGVPLFFIISGMILGLPFAQQHIAGRGSVKLSSYFLRRVTRLEPPYILNLLMRLPLVPWARHVSFLQLLPHFLASLLYLHGTIYGSWPLVHPPSWSLEIEIQFYLLAPLLALFIFRKNVIIRRLSLLLVIAGAGFAQNRFGIVLGAAETSRLQLSIISAIQFFLAGFLLADLFIDLLPRLRQSWLWDILCIPVWLAIFWVNDLQWVPFLAIVAYIGAFKGKLMNRCFTAPIVTTIGGMCYSIYLTHSLILQGCYAVFMRIHPLTGFWRNYWANVILDVPVVLLFGAAFFVLVERPCMDRHWPQKAMAFLTRKRAEDCKAVAVGT
jgi:peptidoglycan/LPS O-acetylase OafA/YrhL